MKSSQPELAIIIVTEFENQIVKPSMKNDMLKLYCRHVHYTLHQKRYMIKKDQIQFREKCSYNQILVESTTS